MVLCYLEGQTNEATARYLRCPAGTVKTRLELGLKKIYDGLKEMRDEL